MLTLQGLTFPPRLPHHAFECLQTVGWDKLLFSLVLWELYTEHAHEEDNGVKAHKGPVGGFAGEGEDRDHPQPPGHSTFVRQSLKDTSTTTTGWIILGRRWSTSRLWWSTPTLHCLRTCPGGLSAWCLPQRSTWGILWRLRTSGC